MTIEATVARLSRDEAKILAHYAAGESLEEIAASTRLPRGDIALAVDALAKNNRNLAHNLAVGFQRRALSAGPPAVPLVRSAPDEAKGSSGPPDPIGELLTRAVASEVTRLVRLADKIQNLVDQLEKELTSHERGAALRSEARELEARLASIREALGSKRPTTGATASADPASDNKAIREWVKANNIACPAMGRIPASVRAAYEEATS